MTDAETVSSRHRLLLLGVLLLAWSLLLLHLNNIPAGFQHDETFNMADAISILNGSRPLYFPANFGREPLFIYSIAGMMRIVGLEFVWVLRLTSVVWAMVGMATTLAFARRWGIHAALVTGALLAVSFPFLFIGRVGLRAVALMPLALGMLLFLERAINRRRVVYWIAAGVLGGIALYTYLAARPLILLPTVAVIIAWTDVRHRQYRVSLIVGMLVCLGLILVIGFPLYDYGRNNPLDLRVAELNYPLLAARAGEVGPLLLNAKETVLALLWRGQDSVPYHYNYPGYPVLTLPLAIATALGVGVLLRGRRNASSMLLLVAIPVGLLPDLLSGGGPIYLRGIIAIPLLFIVAAVGMLWVSAKLPKPIGPLLVLLVLLFHAVDSVPTYYVHWGQAYQSAIIYNGDLRRVAEEAPVTERNFISADYWLDLDAQTYLFYKPNILSATWINSELGLPLPEDVATLYVTASTWPLQSPLDRIASLSSPEPLANDWGVTVAHRYELSSEATDVLMTTWQLQPDTSPVSFGDVLQLQSASIIEGEGEGELIVLSLWEVTGAALLPPSFHFTVVDAEGSQRLQVDALAAVDFKSWQVGDRWVQRTILPLAPEVPPGPYILDVRVVTPPETQAPRRGSEPLSETVTIAQFALPIE